MLFNQHSRDSAVFRRQQQISAGIMSYSESLSDYKDFLFVIIKHRCSFDCDHQMALNFVTQPEQFFYYLCIFSVKAPGKSASSL